MQSISTIPAYYPHFELGGKPSAVFCQLSIVKANGKRYLRTPFAFLDAHGPDDHKRQIELGLYYADIPECDEYLAREYPNWETAAPIMGALCDARHYEGGIVGPSKLADRLDVSLDALYLLARGSKRFTLKQVRAAVRKL